MKLEISKVDKTEVYTLKRIHERDDGVRVGVTDGAATITFRGGKFERCDFQASGPYSREEWKMLALIEKTISKIESGK